MKTNSEFPVIRVTIIAMLLVRAFMLTAQHPILGTTDINAYIKEAPGLPATTAEAAKRAYGDNPLQPDYVSMDNFYKPFEDKVNRRIEDYKQFTQQKMASASTNQADYEQATADMVNKSPVIAGMGGYDKVKSMSQEEAKAAAQRSAAQYQADPFAAHGVQSAGMTALYQKIISDPAYAKKFQNMSEAEQEAELRKYMANDTPAAMTPEAVNAQQEKKAVGLAQADRVRNAMEVQMKTSELLQKIGAVQLTLEQKLTEIKQQGKSHEVISEEIGVRYAAIPIVELGEYGRDRDPEQVRVLRIEEAKMHKERAQQELKQNTAALAEAAASYQIVVSEYLDYLKKSYGKIYGGMSPKDRMEGTNTEQPLVAMESGLINIAMELSQKSRELTKEAARWEANCAQVLQGYQAK